MGDGTDHGIPAVVDACPWSEAVRRAVAENRPVVTGAPESTRRGRAIESVLTVVRRLQRGDDIGQKLFGSGSVALIQGRSDVFVERQIAKSPVHADRSRGLAAEIVYRRNARGIEGVALSENRDLRLHGKPWAAYGIPVGGLFRVADAHSAAIISQV